MLADLEKFAATLPSLTASAHALIISSARTEGFCAGADLRELYFESQKFQPTERSAKLRDFLERIHAVMNAIDAAADYDDRGGAGRLLRRRIRAGAGLRFDYCGQDGAVRVSGVAARSDSGFGGIPRLKRDLGNGVVRDLLLTGRTIGAEKAASVGLVSQVVGEGQALNVARRTAAQLGKFDRGTATAAKGFY